MKLAPIQCRGAHNELLNYPIDKVKNLLIESLKEHSQITRRLNYVPTLLTVRAPHQISGS